MAKKDKLIKLLPHQVSKKSAGRIRITVPTLGVWPNHLYLNRHAMEMMGNKRGVMIFWDNKQKKLSLWFWKEIKSSPDAKNTFAVTPYSDGSGRITAGILLKKNNLYEVYMKLNKVVIPLHQDREEPDLFYAYLK